MTTTQKFHLSKEEFKQARLDLGLSQSEMCKILEYKHPVFISQMETGKEKVSAVAAARTLLLLANKENERLNEIINNTQEDL